MCPPDCPCATLTYIEVVPLTDDPNCPSDEVLLLAWGARECLQCLTWWVDRVRNDIRYQQIISQTQRKWPGIPVSDLWLEVTATIWQQRMQLNDKPINNVPAYFRTLLKRAAYRQNLAQERSREIEFKPNASYAAVMDVPSTDPRVSRITDCLKKLSQTEHHLTQGFYFQGESCSQLAKALHKTLAATTQLLYRTRTKIGECVDKRDNTND